VIHKLGKVGLLAALASVLACAYLMTIQWVPPVAGQGDSRVQAAIKQMAIDTKAEQRIDRLQPLLSSLGQPTQTQASPIDLALLGYRRIVPPAAPPPPAVNPPAPQVPNYVVSMTYVSANRRFAVIDGQFYREGARLPGGERVVTISPNAVRIEEEGMTRQLEIQKDRSALSEKGGTLRIDTIDIGGDAQPAAKPRAAWPSTS
jgi:hypothetical protein